MKTVLEGRSWDRAPTSALTLPTLGGTVSVGAARCTVGCLAAPLTLSQMPETHPYPTVTTQNRQTLPKCSWEGSRGQGQGGGAWDKIACG